MPELHLLLVSAPHFLELLLNLKSVLGVSNNASLRNLLSVFVVEDHAHGVFEVFKFFLINGFNRAVRYLALLNQRKQDVRSQGLHPQVELLGYLALLQGLVDPSDVLSEGGVVVILDAVVRSVSVYAIELLTFHLAA